MRFKLNGVETIFDGDPDLKLQEYLKSVQGIHLPRTGCSGDGICGACTILLNDRPVLSCLMTMRKIEGHSVVTPDESGQSIQDIFSIFLRKEGTVECSYCVPFITIIARENLEKETPSILDATRSAVNQKLCRCLGRDKITTSFSNTAEILRDGIRMTMYKTSGEILDK